MKWTVFDLEFNQLLPQLGPWPDDLRIICASMLSSNEKDPQVWYEAGAMSTAACLSPMTLEAFIDRLLHFYTLGHRLVTWGGSASDWRMLFKECPSKSKTIKLLALDSIDIPMCSCIGIGTMMGLNAACKALGFSLKEDTASAEVCELWYSSAENRQKVLQHVSNDASATMIVLTTAYEKKCLNWVTQKNAIKSWTFNEFYTVKECLSKELPSVPWTIGPNQNAKLMARWLVIN